MKLIFHPTSSYKALKQKIAFATYETPFAPGGGISAVMDRLPHAVKEVSSNDTFVISPFHRNIAKTKKAASEMSNLGTVTIDFDGVGILLDILMLDQGVSWIFLKPQNKIRYQPPFFDGANHPYDVQRETRKGESVLLRDSLFLGKAIALSLPIIDPHAAWILLLQDWETATTCFSIPGSFINEQRIKTWLTLHNSYDNGISPEDFKKIGVDPANIPGKTVLQCALPLVHDPIFTVSEQYARDFSTEILISEILIPHIFSEITPRLVGVNNGIFRELAVPKSVISASKYQDYTQFSEWKSANKEKAFSALNALTDSPDTPVWGNLEKFLKDDSPWFVMAGRDDSRQKGYEIACIAIDKYLFQGGTARFIFFPIPGDEGLPGIKFIRNLTEKFPESVLGLPFLFREGYFAVMLGSSYGIMPSYYEPFGMANEFYLSGVVCIGRATGGILQQVVPLRGVKSFSPAVKRRSNKLHSAKSPPTGLLFRERDDTPNALDDWFEFNEARYEVGSSFDRLKQRKELALFQSMADELTKCIQDAVDIYDHNQNIYYEMLLNGIAYTTKNFNWEDSAKKYTEFIQQEN